MLFALNDKVPENAFIEPQQFPDIPHGRCRRLKINQIKSRLRASFDRKGQFMFIQPDLGINDFPAAFNNTVGGLFVDNFLFLGCQLGIDNAH